MIVEIHAAEGGADAKDLVHEQRGIYARLCIRRGWTMETLSEEEGGVTLRVSGAGVDALFAQEAGGHRWQRVPPTERRGRVQTSTVTVAVLTEATPAEWQIPDSQLEWKAIRGSGAGGQARNKTSNCVQLKHVLSGRMVRCESERSQAQNLATAKVILQAKIRADALARVEEAQGSERRRQMGSGMRGDKRRTVRVRDEKVHDHRDGRRWDLRDYMRGEW